MKKIKIIALILFGLTIIYIGYLQASNIYKFNRIDQIKKENIKLNKQIKELKLEKAEADYTNQTASKELENLNQSLLQNEAELNIAIKKLNDLN